MLTFLISQPSMSFLSKYAMYLASNSASLSARSPPDMALVWARAGCLARLVLVAEDTARRLELRARNMTRSGLKQLKILSRNFH